MSDKPSATNASPSMEEAIRIAEGACERYVRWYDSGPSHEAGAIAYDMVSCLRVLLAASKSAASEKERTPAEIGKAIADKLAEHHGPQIEEAARNMAHASVIGLGVGPVPRPSVQSAGGGMTLADAVLAYDTAIHSCANDPEKMASFCSAQGDDLDTLYFNMVQAARESRDTGTASSERRTVPGMKWELVEDNPPLNVAQLHTVGELFGIRLVDGCSNGCAELYVEDDGHWHFKMRFDRQWLNDLAFVAKPSSAQNAEGVAGKPVAWRWHWKGGDEPDVWAYSETEVRSNEHQHAEPLYARSAKEEKA